MTRPPRSPRGGLTVLAAKGRNARLAGRDKKAQRREDDKMLDGVERAAEKRADKRAAKTKREPGLKYSKRGKVSSQPGQVSKAALKRIREATAASKAVEEVDEQRAAEKRQEYQRAQSRGIPQAVTDRMGAREGGHVLGRRRDSSQHPRALAERRGEGGGEGRKRFPGRVGRRRTVTRSRRRDAESARRPDARDEDRM